MRKIVITVLATLFMITDSGAQAFEEKIEYNKVKQACLAIEYNYPAAAVENAFVDRLEKLGYKGKEEKGMFNKDKGFRVYKGAMIADISTARYDYIVNIERKSRKADEESVLYLVIQKSDMNVLTKLNATELSNAKKFLNELLPDIEAANLELQITAQEETVSKAEKKLKNLQNDKEDMERKIRKLQEDIKLNEENQKKQESEIETQKKNLDVLRGKRKGTI